MHFGGVWLWRHGVKVYSTQKDFSVSENANTSVVYCSKMTAKELGSMSVLIAGGGPAGLLAAHALNKQGYTCTIFEQDAFTGARPRDWNFGIYWAQQPLQDCLPDKLIDRVLNEGQVDSLGVSPNSVLPLYHSVSGELLKNIPIPNQIRLHRLNFLKILREGLDVRYGKRIQNIESDGQRVTVSFQDGTTEEGDLLIGAEGAHSKVREFLVGKEKAALQKTPLVATHTMVKLPKEAAELSQKAHPRFYAHNHPDNTMWISCVHDAWVGKQPGDINFMILFSRMADDDYDPSSLQGPAILEDLKKRAVTCGEPFKSILLAIPDGTRCWHNRLSYWIPEPWDNRNGTVTLIGDAAHPMTYHRGQGFNNAVLDVATLARQIAEKGLLKSISGGGDGNGRRGEDGNKSGIDGYEEEMWVRGKEAVSSSLENSLFLHNWDTMKKSHLFVSGALQQVIRDSV